MVEHSSTALVVDFTSSGAFRLNNDALGQVSNKNIHLYMLGCRGAAADKMGVLGILGLNQALSLTSPVTSGKSLNLSLILSFLSCKVEVITVPP